MSDNENYKKLGITKDASISEIKKSYHRKAFELHPDRSKKPSSDAELEFKDLNTAYHNIMNNKKEKIRNQEKKKTGTQKSRQEHYKNDFMTSFGTDFSIFDFIFFKNMNRVERTYSSSYQDQKKRDTTINLKQCSGKHDKYTICLKCGKY